MNDLIVMKPQVPDASPFTAEQLKLITEVIAPGATDSELQLFLYRCKNMGLDPLKPGQIHFVKYGNGPGTIVVGIEGFRVKAERTGKWAGTQRGVLRNDKGDCIGAWAEAYRHDWQKPARVEVSLSEYNSGRATWKQMPESMIQKVAEAAALRMAFPDDLGGIYTKEEMEQAEVSGRVTPKQPEAGDGNTEPMVYKLTFGKWAGRTLEEILRNHGERAIQDYVAFLEGAAQKKGVPLQGAAAEFIEQASRFLAAFECEAALSAKE